VSPGDRPPPSRRSGALGPSVLPVLAAALAAAAPAAAGVRVVGPAGEPVAAAAIEIYRPPGAATLAGAATARVAEGESDAEGLVTLAVPIHDRLLWLVDHPGYAPGVFVRPGGSPVPVRLGRGAALRGRVRAAGEDAAPPAEGRVCASWEESFDGWGRTRGWRRCAPIGEDGSFAVPGVNVTEVTVHVHVPGFLPLRRPAVAGRGLELTLERGTLLAGRVVDSRRRPVPGAAVGAGRDLETEADAAGRFEVAAPALPVTLVVRAPGHRPAEVRVSEPAAEVVVVLAPGEALAGVLVDEQSLPIAAADLWLERRTPPGEWRGERRALALDPRGGFAADLPAPGRYRARFEAAGYRPLALPAVEVAASQLLDLGVLGLERGGVVAGCTVDGESGEPIGGAEIELAPNGAALVTHLVRGRSFKAVTGDDGRFEVAGLEAGSYRLSARRDGYATTVEEVVIEGSGVHDLGDLALGRGVLLSGVVVDRAGELRPGLRVRLFDPLGSPLAPLAEWLTDAGGAFTGQAVEPGVYRVRVDGSRLLLAQEIEVPEGVTEHEVRLVAGGVRLAGVVHRGGEPVAGGLLTLVADLDPGDHRGKVILHGGGPLAGGADALGFSESQLVTEIAADGTFAVDDAPSGRLWARVYEDAGSETARELIVPDRAEAWVEIDLGGAALEGRVTDAATGAGIAAQLALFSVSGRPVAAAAADGEGRFRLADLAPGRYALEASAEGYRPARLAELDVRPGVPPVELALEPGGSGEIEIRLVRADGGPAAGIPVNLLDAGGRMVRSLLTDALGVRRYGGLPEGEYVVVWSDPLAGTGVAGGLTVADGEVTVIERVLGRGGPLTVVCGSVRCAGAALESLGVYPVAEGVELSPYLDGVSAGMRFSGDGRLPLGRLAPGSYLVDVAAAGDRWQGLVALGGEDGTVFVVE